MNIKKYILPIIGIGLMILSFLFAYRYLPNRIYSYIDRHYGAPRLAPNIKVTFPEGTTNEEMADILMAKFTNFNRAEFITLSAGKQGYLFPDTYFFYKNEKPSSMVAKLQNTFYKKALPLIENTTSTRSIKDTIIMASIIEAESNGKEDAPIVAGILWKRLDNGIPLQVDVAPDTYKTKGLPSVPITNPGLVSIAASLTPAVTPYLYYLHDKDGMIHLAKSFDEHKKNIKLYLRK